MKNIETLLNSYAKVRQVNPSVSLDIIGKDTLVNNKSYWDTLISDISPEIASSINYYGPVPHNNMPSMYSTAQVCVFPSIIESFGLVAAEAMACGRPVIYSIAGPGPELIQDGINGLLCDPSNPSELSEQILTVLSDYERARIIGIKAAETIEAQFKLSTIVDENINFYTDCIINPRTD